MKESSMWNLSQINIKGAFQRQESLSQLSELYLILMETAGEQIEKWDTPTLEGLAGEPSWAT